MGRVDNGTPAPGGSLSSQHSARPFFSLSIHLSPCSPGLGKLLRQIGSSLSPIFGQPVSQEWIFFIFKWSGKKMKDSYFVTPENCMKSKSQCP